MVNLCREIATLIKSFFLYADWKRGNESLANKYADKYVGWPQLF